MSGAGNQKPAVILLSGALDSAVVLAVAGRDGFAARGLSVDDGQRHRLELDAARRVAALMGAVEHRAVRVDLRAIGGSALTDTIEVAKDTPEIGAGIPATYVP